MKVHANGLDIEVEVNGEASNPAVLLTMGLGMLRQLLAVAADTARYQYLPHIKSPTLVIHGKADPLVPMKQHTTASSSSVFLDSKF